MKKEQILKKAIKKAEKNGYLPKIQYKMNPMSYLNTIIFSHDFAKAFWGEEYADEYGDTFNEHEKKVKDGRHFPIDYQWTDLDLAWGYHLREMVLEKDPILYLERFI